MKRSERSKFREQGYSLFATVKDSGYTFRFFIKPHPEDELLEIMKKERIVFQSMLPERLVYRSPSLIKKLEKKGLIKRVCVKRRYLLFYTGD